MKAGIMGRQGRLLAEGTLNEAWRKQWFWPLGMSIAGLGVSETVHGVCNAKAPLTVQLLC